MKNNLLEKIFYVKKNTKHIVFNFLGLKIKFQYLKKSKIVLSQLHKNKNYKDIKIAFYIGHEGSATRYRVYNIVEALSKKGIIADTYTGNCFKDLNSASYDLLFIFRSGNSDSLYKDKILKTINLYKKKNIPIIYDIDDLLLKLKHSDNFINIIKRCDYITVSTRPLAEALKIFNPNGIIIKNTINYTQYEIAQKLIKKTKPCENNKIKIVYQCGTKSHDKDFKVCEKALYDILQKHSNTEFHLIGSCNISKHFDKFSNRIYKKNFMPYTDLLEYVSNMDINIAPLEINEFNECKSELKLFESALVKLPSIVSPTIPYKDIVENSKNGYLASNNEEWYECLKNLIEDKNLRNNISNQAYKDFVPMFYIENNILNILEIYRNIITERNKLQQNAKVE